MAALKKELFPLLSFLALSTLAFSQTKEYYKDIELQTKTFPSKANYALITGSLPDGRITKELVELKNNRTLKKEDNKGEPMGIWYKETESGLKKYYYDFTLNYKDTACKATPLHPRIKDPFADNDSLGYKAPQITSGEKSLSQYIQTNLQYPRYALSNGISGKVILSFTLTDKGTIENIAVKKSAHPSLDKEAVRLIRSIDLESPPQTSGTPQAYCVTYPIDFKVAE